MTDYYVDFTDGSNGAAGSEGAPWKTLSYAVGGTSAVAAGDNIYLREDTYTEFVAVNVSGTSGNPITIQGYTGETATLEGVAGTEGIIEIGGGISYITLGEGLYFSYGHAKPGGVKKFSWIDVHGTTGANACSNIILENFNLERSGWDSGLPTLAASTWDEFGIMINGATDCTVDGVWIRGVSQGVALRNKCYDATIKNCDIQYTVQSNITVGTSQGVLRRAVIINNILGNSAIEDGIQFTQDFSNRADDDTDDTNQGTIIAYNQIGQCGENGIDLKGTTRIIIHGNVIWGITGSNNGWSPTSGSNRNALNSISRGSNAYSHRVIISHNIIYDSSRVWLRNNWKAWNNTFVYNNRDYTGTNSSATPNGANFSGINVPSAAPGTGARNNIFSNHNSADVAVLAGSNQPNNEVDLDFNLYTSKKWVDLSVGSPYTTYTTIQSWRTRLAANNWRYGKDANSIVLTNHAAIQFVDVPSNPTAAPDTYDFNLQSSSPAKSAGGWLTLTNGSGSGDDWVTLDDSTWLDTVYSREDIFDRYRIFFNGQEREVIAIDDANNRVQIDSVATWSDNTPVYGIGQGFEATATPDIGSGGFLSYSGGGGSPPPAPPTSGSGSISIVRVACATSTGEQTITLDTALSDTPVAWRFTVVKATADDTADDGLAIGWGWAWDNSGTTIQGAVGVRSKHNVSTTDTSRRSIEDGCVMLLDPTSTGIDGQASFVSGSTTNVVIDWTNAPAAGSFLVVEAFAGVEAYLAQFTAEETLDNAATITCGFAADWIEVAGHNKPIPDNSAHVRLSHGICTITSGTPTQQSLMWNTRDNLGTSAIAAYLSDTYVGGELLEGGSVQSALLVENITGTAFDIATKVGNFSDATHEFFVFAIKHTGLSVYSGVVAMPTSTDSAHEHAVGFTAGSAYAIATTLTAVNSGSTAGTGFADGVWDGVNQYAQGVADQDNVGTTNTQTRSDDKFINVDFHTGSNCALATISAVGTDLVGNYTAVDSTARYMILAAVEEVVTASITALGSADPTSGTVELEVDFTDESGAVDTTITEWLWDFGDGNTSTSQHPTHTYTAAGEYTPSVTAGDGVVSDTYVFTQTILVEEAPPPDVSPSPTGTKILTSATYNANPRSDVQASAQVG